MKKYLCLAVLFMLPVFVIAQSGYYSSIDGVEGGATLKTALYNLLKEHTRINYGSGVSSTWGAFFTTDRNPATNQVYDMYSAEVRYFGDQGDAIDGMNIEHSVAKSWWGGTKNDAYCDLHHLNPSDQEANNRKGNFPLAKLESVTWDNGVTFVGKATIDGYSVSAYEPCDEYKGDFARVYMYMFTCYQNLTYKYTWMNYENSTYPTFKPWAVELLLQWHKQDPVSEREIVRNNAVYSIQGNRNPYIDYPQLAEYVWGDSVDYTFNLDGAIIGGGGNDNTNAKVYIMEAFSSSLGDFTVVNTEGTHQWDNKYGCAYISAYESSTYTNYAAESWLISPSMDFSTEKGVNISFDYVTRYNTVSELASRNQLLISDNYTGDVTAATWKVVDFSVAQGSDWTFTSTGDIALPAEYMGKENVTIAFKYLSTATKAGTWEVKNVVVTGSAVPDDGTGDDNTDDDNTGSGDDNTGGDNTGDDTGTGGTEGNNGNYPFERFTLVTDEASLTVGDSIIIAYNDVVMGAQSDKYRARIEGAVIESNAIASYPEGTQILVLEEGTKEGTFAFVADGLYLAAASSTKNYVYSNQTINDDASWLISVAADGAAVITAQGSFTRNILQYNTSSPRFSCYTGTQKSVTIYAKSPVSTTSVEDVLVEAATAVDVYTLQGVKVRAAVNPSSALEGLPAGFYIISGEKVYKK